LLIFVLFSTFPLKYDIYDASELRVAKIENTFILNAQYKLTAKEQKVFYYLVTHLDPKNEKEFYSISVPLKDIETMLRDNDERYGSFYEKMEALCDNMIAKSIKFPSNILLNGKKLKERINFFSSIKPMVDEEGQTVVQFSFSPDMSPFLLQLHHYVNIDIQAITPMSNTHAIRMYSIFKSEKDRLRGVKNVVTMQYFLEELKAILGIGDNYKGQNFSDFRLHVLDKIRDEINDNVPTMSVNYEYLKTQRKITGVTFNVSEKQVAKANKLPKAIKEPKLSKKALDFVPNERDLAVLTRAKLQAYNALLEFGVFAGIAYKQILPKIKGSEFEGFEDFFIEKALLHFEKNAILNTTKGLKASTFVTWWTKNKVFETGDVWADILEKLVKHKKQMEIKSPITFENRSVAKTMTNAQFEEYVQSQKG
jgi:plasmid replication initiation protein